MSTDKEYIDPTHSLGYAFEKHVIGLFGKDFKVIKWILDGAGHTREEIDFNPDITVEHLPTGDVIGIECKFRSTLYNGSISWAKEYQLAKYDRYKERTGNPVFVIIGLGGTPEKPEVMYCLPLWKAKYNILDTRELKRYRRDSRKKFSWDGKSGELR
ncbi:hypothetical protein CUJ83_06795 [Methanocella sp. CWC-04]|uniref:Uncharacterized protein n=1 Tax=Methanooceanicella nereidis TaxID=2052831 RepID=A0AAP2RBV9_9EURY|nr:hypothetical protein [Methanocella sp. CWC-04]MCD1294706.1 hypothetical protein [Methanocella sp. CWC-04]